MLLNDSVTLRRQWDGNFNKYSILNYRIFILKDETGVRGNNQIEVWPGDDFCIELDNFKQAWAAI